MRTSFIRRLGVVVAACVAAVTGGVAKGQCGAGWVPLGTPQAWPGVNNTVYATTTWDPDGAGPQVPVLVVGGDFTVAGAVNAARVATWNGTEWRNLGPGLNSTVRTLAVYNGQLYAGGDFTLGGGNYLARWTGSSWQPVAGGTNNSVNVLKVVGSNLYLGGYFTTAGAGPVVNANRVARFNGTTFTALGVGVGGASFEYVADIEQHGGQLYFGGLFASAGGITANNIVSYNEGTGAWGALVGPSSTGTGGAILALASYNGQLYLGGQFTNAGGDPLVDYLTVWDGFNFQVVGASPNFYIQSLEVHNGQLVAGGRFTTIGGGAVYYLATWNDVSWQPVGVGVEGDVYATTTYNGQLYFGGGFASTRASAGLSMYFVGGWTGLDFVSLGGGTVGLGADATIFDMSTFNNQLIVGGNFVNVGGQRIPRIARWNGTTWSGLGTGVGDGFVDSTITYNNALYVSGSFSIAGGIPVANIARWSGSSWASLGAGLNNDATTMEVFGGNLVVGGTFTSAGGTAGRNRIATYNGSTWGTLGTGFNSTVRALAVYNNELYAGGDFDTTQGGPSGALNYIAKWNGTQWVNVGGGMGSSFDPVYALIVYNNQLVAAGNFDTAGGVPANYVAAWDGTSWQPLGGGLTNSARTLAVSNGLLYVGGLTFQQPSGAAIWNGSTWLPMGTGVDNVVWDMEPFQGRMYAGGDFETAGGLPAIDFASFTIGGAGRTILQQPQSQSVCIGQTLDLSFAVTGGGPYTYQWRRDGVNIVDSSALNGAQTPTLTILQFAGADAGVYDVFATDGCGAFLSAAATLSVSTSCPLICDDIDFNNDGLFPDVQDIQAFLTVFAGGDCF